MEDVMIEKKKKKILLSTTENEMWATSILPRPLADSWSNDPALSLSLSAFALVPCEIIALVLFHEIVTVDTF